MFFLSIGSLVGPCFGVRRLPAPALPTLGPRSRSQLTSRVRRGRVEGPGPGPPVPYGTIEIDSGECDFFTCLCIYIYICLIYVYIYIYIKVSEPVFVNL